MDAPIEELEKLLGEATPGPWTVTPPWCGFSSLRGGDGNLVFGLAAGGQEEARPEGECSANAALIVAAINSLPAILERLKAAEARVAVLEPEVAGQAVSVDWHITNTKDLEERLAKAEGENERLRGALTQMVDEKADYMRLNNLGDPEAQHTIKAARQALETTHDPR